MAKDPYTQGLKAKYGSMMTGFADVTLADVGNLVSYINEAAKPAPPPPPGAEVQPSGNQNAIIFGVISLILGIIALILMQVNSNLKKCQMIRKGLFVRSLFPSIAIKYISQWPPLFSSFSVVIW